MGNAEISRRGFLAAGATLVTAAAVGVGLEACGSGPEAHPAPTTSPLPAEAGEIGLALSDSLFGLSPEAIGQRLDRVRSLGATAIRFDWDGLQYSIRGWEPTDQIMRAAAERQLGVLATVSFTPYSNQRPEYRRDYIGRPVHVGEFADFAHAAAQRYKSHGPISYEVWNEPNVSPGGANPAEYVSLFNGTSDALRSAHKGATVAIGGLAPSKTSDGNMSPVDFLSAILDGGLTGYDAVSLHPYSYPLLPDQADPGNAFTQIEGDPSLPGMATIYGILQRHGRAKLPIWLTEMGAPTAGTSAVSTAKQAETIRQDLSHHFEHADVPRRFIFTLQDWPGHYMFGLDYANGRPKPAAAVFHDIADGQPK